MNPFTRRSFLTAAAAWAATAAHASRNAGGAAPAVRQPALGQSWRYAKHDLFTRSIVDTQIDAVSAIGRTVEIGSRSQKGGNELVDLSWGSNWLKKYMEGEKFAVSAASEIHAPWGMVLVDPHWSEVEVFEEPVPLWPARLQPGWSRTVNTRYETRSSKDELPWQVTMKAGRWETIAVPAGHFYTLRYTNIINFRFTNVSERDAAQRLETVWFAPEIGRWAARESTGTFYQDVGERFRESSYRWELLSWT